MRPLVNVAGAGRLQAGSYGRILDRGTTNPLLMSARFLDINETRNDFAVSNKMTAIFQIGGSRNCRQGRVSTPEKICCRSLPADDRERCSMWQVLVACRQAPTEESWTGGITSPLSVIEQPQKVKKALIRTCTLHDDGDSKIVAASGK